MVTLIRGESLVERNAPLPTTGHWRRRYAARLVCTDVISVLWAAIGATVLNFGMRREQLSVAGYAGDWLNYWVLSIFAIIVWTVALGMVGSRGYRLIGTGTAEYKAVLQSGAVVLLTISLLAFALKIEFSRGYILTLIPVGLGALLVSRWLWRCWLRLHREQGRFCSRVLLVGSSATTTQIASELKRHPDAGYLVVGAVNSGAASAGYLQPDIPVYGTVDDVLPAVVRSGADTVLVTDGHDLSPAKLRELSWSLEPGRQHLVMAPSLTDIAGPRIHARPVAGLPLVHVETPRYEGIDRFMKRFFDFAASATLLLVLSVPLLVVALSVWLTSPGGLFFAHERIGKNGRPFKMLKFRSMVANADAQLEGLLKSQGTSEQPLFKINNDPRITRVGAFLRRYSVDEVPQLINVLRGDMSLVGPRPQVAKEVALYNNAAARRLFVKPGMTGLWQVSGRSNLNWDEAVRLDLYYVENWSILADMSILAKTLKAVVGSDGAV